MRHEELSNTNTVEVILYHSINILVRLYGTVLLELEAGFLIPQKLETPALIKIKKLFDRWKIFNQRQTAPEKPSENVLYLADSQIFQYKKMHG